jgi:hypothetical protein
MNAGVLAADEVGNLILYVDGLCIEVMWTMEENASDLTGDAGVKVIKGMSWVFLGEGHDDATEVALERDDIDPLEEKSDSESLDVTEDESSASESEASGELAKHARSVRRLRICERRTRAARAMVARMAVLISTAASFSMSTSSETANKAAEGWMGAEAAHTSRCSASPANRTRTRPGSMNRSNSRPPRAFIHVYHSILACLAAIKIGFGGVHEGERVKQRRPEPRFGSDGDHDEERYGVRIVERACWRAMKRAGVMADVRGRVRNVMAWARAADTEVEERMEGMADMFRGGVTLVSGRVLGAVAFAGWTSRM